jgi:hypothetical protein
MTKARLSMSKAGPVTATKVTGSVKVTPAYESKTVENIPKKVVRRKKKAPKVNDLRPALMTYTQKLELEELRVVTDSTWTEAQARKEIKAAKKRRHNV